MPAGGSTRSSLRRVCIVALVLAIGLLGGCGADRVRRMEVTGYCGCGACTGWERGSWRYLKLDFWNRYVDHGPRKGRSYDGRTASRTVPREPHPGLFSWDSLTHPWMIPVRLVFPWLWLARDGTIAADTRHYDFGTRMHVPGWGWGRVEDRGGAIVGPNRLDLYFDDHDDALEWGRQRVEVTIED